MRPKLSDDFEWILTEQPHISRRNIILEKYPQIKQVFILKL